MKATQLAGGEAEPSCGDPSSGGIVRSHACNFPCSRSWISHCPAGRWLARFLSSASQRPVDSTVRASAAEGPAFCPRGWVRCPPWCVHSLGHVPRLLRILTVTCKGEGPGQASFPFLRSVWCAVEEGRLRRRHAPHAERSETRPPQWSGKSLLLYLRPRARVCVPGLLLVFQRPVPEEGQAGSRGSEHPERQL